MYVIKPFIDAKVIRSPNDISWQDLPTLPNLDDLGLHQLMLCGVFVLLLGLKKYWEWASDKVGLAVPDEPLILFAPVP